MSDRRKRRKQRRKQQLQEAQQRLGAQEETIMAFTPEEEAALKAVINAKGTDKSFIERHPVATTLAAGGGGTALGIVVGYEVAKNTGEEVANAAASTGASIGKAIFEHITG